MSTIVVTGAGGFIGGNMCKRLKDDGHFVLGVDNEAPRYRTPDSSWYDKYFISDLRSDQSALGYILDHWSVNEVYHFAADMGGMGFISSNHYDILQNNLRINLNVASSLEDYPEIKFLFSSSVCVYPEFLQNYAFLDEPYPMDEDSAYPAWPQDEYGWEKLTAERIFMRLHKEHGVNVHIARFHNTYGPMGAWMGGREKAPAALCRKIAVSRLSDDPITVIDVWGDGQQKRPFIYVDDTVEACIRLQATDFHDPVNVGPSNDAIVTIDELASEIFFATSEHPLYPSHDYKPPMLEITHVPGAEGVRSRGASNDLLKQVLGWEPQVPLRVGLYETYKWIEEQVIASREGNI